MKKNFDKSAMAGAGKANSSKKSVTIITLKSAAEKLNKMRVELTTIVKRGFMKVLESRKGTLFRSGEREFIFTERGVNARRQPWMWWVTLVKCLFGKLTVNSRHVQVQLFFPHGSYQGDVRLLADMLIEQAELIAEALCSMDPDEYRQLVASIQAMEPKEAA